MKIYSVNYGNDNEGCYKASGLFTYIDNAKTLLEALVKEQNDVGCFYEPAGEDYYRDGYDYIKIFECELQ